MVIPFSCEICAFTKYLMEDKEDNMDRKVDKIMERGR